MTRRFSAIVVTFTVLCLTVVLLSAGGSSLAAEKEKDAKSGGGEEFSATFVNMNAPGGNMSNPTFIKIKTWTTDDEVNALKKILVEKGQQALLDATSKLDLGYIRIAGSLGYPIAIARERKTDAGRTILLIANRPFAGISLVAGGQAADYLFGVVELKVDAKGKGEGQIVGAAQIDIEKDGMVQIKSMGTPAMRLLEVTKR